MSRLQIEFRRLFLATEAASAGEAITASDLVDSAGRVRALVLELARPADWQPLANVWKGVQAELDLPAPAIAVNGTDGMQLWFSMAMPLDAAPAHAFLDALRLRYLAAVKPDRVSLLAGAGSIGEAAVIGLSGSASAPEAIGGWPAFVAPDLAPIFSDTPWLDLPPGDEGQARLLASLESIKPARFDAALGQLRARAATEAPAAMAIGAGPRDGGSSAACHPDAKRFLLSVMNDEAAPLALRIEAAKALLPHGQMG